MRKGFLGFILAIVGFLSLAAAMWVYLKPAYPIIPTSQYQKAGDIEHSPGRAHCYPSRLNRLPEPQAADERYRCEQSAEHRRLYGDLVQQTRSADADLALVHLTYTQALILLAGTILGLLTLVAAFSAAWYAKRAAEVAEGGLEHNRDMARLELRPYVHVDQIYFRPPHGGSQRRGQLTVTVKNFGSTPAIRFSIEGGWGVRDPSMIGELRRVNLRLRRYACTDEIPQGHSVTISLIDERLVPRGEDLAVFCTICFRYSDKFGCEYMRWETYIMEGPHNGRGEFRFYSAT